LYEKLKGLYQNVSLTYGYLTKHTRITNGLPKTHTVDARCISGNPGAREAGIVYFQKFVRTRNRQIHKATINKGGTRKLNQAPKYVFGYQLFDKVKMQDLPAGQAGAGAQEGYIFGRRSSGYFDIRKLDGTKISSGMSYKKLRLLEKRRTLLSEARG
jgi:N6-L-threonylcarbamoyladenine synthase